MTKGFYKLLIGIIFLLGFTAIALFIFFPSVWNKQKSREESQPRIVIPRNPGTRVDGIDNTLEFLTAINAEIMTTKVPFDEGEVVLSVLNGTFDGSPFETQFVAYRNLLEIDGPIYIAYIDYNPTYRRYFRVWDVPTAATRPGTIDLDTMDLLGDRSVCVILKGVNGLGEHTITIFRKNPAQNRNAAAAGDELFQKIAEIRIDGSINILEMTRSQAYQMGFGRGDSFAIAGYGRDFDSSNILDQVEIIYTYNTGNGLYEQSRRTRIPGAQVEQRRVRELLGDNKAFEEFIYGLWYHISPQGTIERYQFIYFDPPNREIVFYGDGTQQVFNWQSSAATRYGLFINSQNISISTLRRSVNIELESLESIRIRVVEAVRLKIGVSAPWDGSYRKANPMEHQENSQGPGNAHINAAYDSSLGKIQFYSDGSYELNNRQGKYAFFFIGNQEYLELRPAESASGNGSLSSIMASRVTYLVDAGSGGGENRRTLALYRVRIGSRGIERLQEMPVSLTLTSE